MRPESDLPGEAPGEGQGDPLGDSLPDLIPRRPGEAFWRRLWCLTGAVACFALGVVFWLIPVVTGIPFYVAGLLLLGMASERARQWINRLERRLPLAWRRRLRRRPRS